jgi:predicted Zn finger-like uncharacterized protein
MSTFRQECKNCKDKFLVNSLQIGQTVDCPKCKHLIVVDPKQFIKLGPPKGFKRITAGISTFWDYIRYSKIGNFFSTIQILVYYFFKFPSYMVGALEEKRVERIQKLSIVGNFFFELIFFVVILILWPFFPFLLIVLSLNDRKAIKKDKKSSDL